MDSVCRHQVKDQAVIVTPDYYQRNRQRNRLDAVAEITDSAAIGYFPRQRRVKAVLVKD